MKKILLITGAVLLVLLLLLAAIPFLFQDQIKSQVDKTIAQSVKADVNYEDFSLSLIRGFPNLNLSVDRVSIVGQELFLGDTLLYADQAAVNVNLWSVLFGNKTVIRSISLEHPKMLIKLLDDGTANYDIAVETDTTIAEAETSYAVEIKNWTLNDGYIVYDDQQSKFYLEMEHVAHSGSGDFTQDLFDLQTQTSGNVATAEYDGIAYLEDKQLDGDVTLGIDLPNNRYTFKENKVLINDFGLGFDGWLALSEDADDIQMDLSFKADQSDFQSLLSLVPGMYTENFKDIKSEGKMNMEGRVSGTYNEQQIPEFLLDLKVDNGMFQYPDLPEAVENINVDMTIANETGQLNDSKLDIRTLNMDLGNNPVAGKISMEGLGPSSIDADLDAKLNLDELTRMIPIEGTVLRGLYQLSLKAQGVYDSINHQFPQVTADMSLTNGYIKSDQFPEALENLQLQSKVVNQTGTMEGTRIEVSDFNFVMDGEPVSGNLLLENLDNYRWDLAIKGNIDLEKFTHIIPLEDMTISGMIAADVSSKGQMSDLEAERYDRLPTSGNVQLTNFHYESKDLSHPVHISSARTEFDPRQITLHEVQAKSGSSDFQVQGGISNYINYVFKEEEKLQGNLSLRSNNLNLNEWMTESSDSSQGPTEVLEIPKNIDMGITSEIGTVQYDNMTLTDVRGVVNLNHGVAAMEGVNFNSLGGQFAMSGNYDSRDLKHPKFGINIAIADMAIKQAFNTFSTVQALAPIAKVVDGNFSTNFNLEGELAQNMMPMLNTLTGGGLVQILEAALAGMDSKIIDGLSNLTQFSKKPTGFSLRDVVMNIEIKQGKLNVKPFNVQFGDYATAVSGSTGIDGSLDFNLTMDVPAGVVGNSVNSAIARLTGSGETVDDMITLNFKMGGTYNNPTFGLGGREGSTAGVVTDAVNESVDEAKDSVRSTVQQQKEELKDQGKAQLDSLIQDKIADSTSKELIDDVKDKILKDKPVDGVLNLFKNRKNKEQTADSTGN